MDIEVTVLVNILLLIKKYFLVNNRIFGENLYYYEIAYFITWDFWCREKRR